MKRLPLALTFLATSVLAGCGPSLWPVSTPPPTGNADHRRPPFEDDVVKLSVGVALAFDCYEGLVESCVDASASTADPSIATVRPAFLQREQPALYGGPRTHSVEPRPRAGFVLIAKSPGTTTLTVQSSAGVSTTQVVVD
jgi:hypothetical protein